MPAINFQREFVPMILDGSKHHTIRPKRADGKDARPGQTLYLYYGMRTKQCKKIIEKPCLHVRPLKLEISAHTVTAHIDDKRVPDHASFARNDGFGDMEHMASWFWDHYQFRSNPLTDDLLTLDDLLLIQWDETDY